MGRIGCRGPQSGRYYQAFEVNPLKMVMSISMNDEALRKWMGCRRSSSMVENTEIFCSYREGIGV